LLRCLRDLRASAFIQARIERDICGKPGAVRPVGAGDSELRVHHGHDYREHVQQRGSILVILVNGGDKSTQAKDIKSAQDLARNSRRINDGDQAGTRDVVAEFLETPEEITAYLKACIQESAEMLPSL
jgi:putative addiction module killer protein